MNHSINLRTAKWSDRIGSQVELKKAMKANAEFQTCSVMEGYDKATTPSELKALGYTHAQVRYGHRMEKVWYGPL